MRWIWAYRPWLDTCAASVVALLAWLLLHVTDAPLPPEAIRTSFATGVAALSGMAATAGTFAVGSMVSSDSNRMQRIRSAPKNQKALPGNWVSMLGGPLTAGAASLLTLMMVRPLYDLALAVNLGALSLTLLSFYRAIHWLQFTWGQESHEARKPRTHLPEGTPEPEKPFIERS